jgi:hypothetical protein
MTQKKTVVELAEEMGFIKRGHLWYSDFYLDMLDLTPYELGAEVYLSDGETIQEDGLTNDELRKEYEEYWND